MARKETANTELIQIKVTKLQKDILSDYAKSQGVTVAELTRQQLRPLIARIVSGLDVAA